MNHFETWLDAVLILRHAAKYIQRDRDAVLILSESHLELNRCMGGYYAPNGKKYFPFGLEMLA